MPKVTFISVDGSEQTITATAGESVMATAVRHGVPGVIGECGGNRSCATCHVYVGDEFMSRVGPATGIEEDMLDLAVADRRPNSRLSCQIEVTEALDGLVVLTPSEQP